MLMSRCRDDVDIRIIDQLLKRNYSPPFQEVRSVEMKTLFLIAIIHTVVSPEARKMSPYIRERKETLENAKLVGGPLMEVLMPDENMRSYFFYHFFWHSKYEEFYTRGPPLHCDKNKFFDADITTQCTNPKLCGTEELHTPQCIPKFKTLKVYKDNSKGIKEIKTCDEFTSEWVFGMSEIIVGYIKRPEYKVLNTQNWTRKKNRKLVACAFKESSKYHKNVRIVIEPTHWISNWVSIQNLSPVDDIQSVQSKSRFRKRKIPKIPIDIVRWRISAYELAGIIRIAMNTRGRQIRFEVIQKQNPVVIHIIPPKVPWKAEKGNPPIPPQNI